MSDNKQPEITRELIQEDHPAIYTAIQAEAAKSERERIRCILDEALPGHEAMAKKLAFESDTSPGDAARQINKAEKEARTDELAKLRNKKLEVETLSEKDKGIEPLPDGASIEDKCKHEWENDPKVREEFTSLEVYTACIKGDAKHRVSVAGGSK